MRRFQYARPTTLAEAARLGAERADAVYLAGGTDLLVQLDRGARSAGLVIDLKNVPELDGSIEQRDGSLRIGALATMGSVAGNERVVGQYPALAEAAATVGSVQVRNRATLAGNLCNASPAADTAPPLLVYGATLNIVGSSGRRTMALADFFRGPGRRALERGEIVESIELPVAAQRCGSGFARLTRRRGVDLALVSAACRIDVDGRARFAFGAVGPTPILVTDDSGAMGEGSAPAAVEAASRGLIEATRPITDIRAGADYRRAMALVLIDRVRELALSRLRVEPAMDLAATPAHPRRPARAVAPCGSPVPIVLRVNGVEHHVEAAPHHTLLQVLRRQLMLTGAKESCREGECGACTVLLDGRPVNACLVLAAEMDGHEVTTIEGLERDGALDPLQEAFIEAGAVQCGYCTPGMIVSARHLLEHNASPTRADVQRALEGNLCRCTGYGAILKAVQMAAGAEETTGA